MASVVVVVTTSTVLVGAGAEAGAGTGAGEGTSVSPMTLSSTAPSVGRGATVAMGAVASVKIISTTDKISSAHAMKVK